MTKYLTFTGPWTPKIYDRHPPPLFCSPLLPSHSLSSFVRWYRGYVASSSLHARCTPIDGRFARRAQCFPLRRRTMRRSRGFSTYPSAGKVENGVPWFGKKRLTSRQPNDTLGVVQGWLMYSDFVPLKDVSFFLSLSLFLVFLCSTFRTIRSILWMMEDVEDGITKIDVRIGIKMLKIDALESVWLTFGKIDGITNWKGIDLWNQFIGLSYCIIVW